MRVIITYDLKGALNESVHSIVKDAMKELGYMDSFFIKDEKGGNKKHPDGTTIVYTLPNTTLWHYNSTPEKAKTYLLKVAKDHKAEVERLFADEFTTNWSAIEGKPYTKKPEFKFTKKL